MNDECFILLKTISQNQESDINELAKIRGLDASVIEGYLNYLLYWGFIKEQLIVKTGKEFERGHVKSYKLTEKGKNKIEGGED